MCQGSRVTKSAFVRQFCIFVFKTTSRNPSSLPSVPKCRSTESTTAKTRKKIRGQNSHQKATKRLLKGMTWLVTLLLYYLLIAMSKKENEPCLEQWLGCFGRRVCLLVLFLHHYFCYSQIRKGSLVLCQIYVAVFL